MERLEVLAAGPLQGAVVVHRWKAGSIWYPVMFRSADVVIVHKIGLLP